MFDVITEKCIVWLFNIQVVYCGNFLCACNDSNNVSCILESDAHSRELLNWDRFILREVPMWGRCTLEEVSLEGGSYFTEVHIWGVLPWGRSLFEGEAYFGVMCTCGASIFRGISYLRDVLTWGRILLCIKATTNRHKTLQIQRSKYTSHIWLG